VIKARLKILDKGLINEISNRRDELFGARDRVLLLPAMVQEGVFLDLAPGGDLLPERVSAELSPSDAGRVNGGLEVPDGLAVNRRQGRRGQSHTNSPERKCEVNGSRDQETTRTSG